MFLIVGLGNPGLKFRKTRHNIGFRVLDAFQKENDFPKFKMNKKAKVEVSKGVINGQAIFLAKPQTYMNESGFAVKALISNLKLQIANLIIIHDDFDLAFGEMKITENSGSGGHHGVESIIQSLGTRDFKRLKIGIRPISGPQGSANLNNGNPVAVNLKAEDFVLKKFSKDEETRLAEIMKKAISHIATEVH
ncbi:MAG: aminoacyl-tRNA hydrolase [Candidatus Pacebacteria bacterium]|nr:aminoacyl-tRNA hydrolase [Candidatus Paceibacterota bacterium]